VPRQAETSGEARAILAANRGVLDEPDILGREDIRRLELGLVDRLALSVHDATVVCVDIEIVGQPEAPPIVMWFRAGQFQARRVYLRTSSRLAHDHSVPKGKSSSATVGLMSRADARSAAAPSASPALRLATARP
jgi:hypothetical protein